MRFFSRIIVSIFASLVICLPAFAQETQTKIVDEVVVVVNNDVITLSRIKREIKQIVDEEVAQGKKREDVQKAVDEKKEIYYGLIEKQDFLIEKAYQIHESNKKLDIREEFVTQLEKSFKERTNG